MEIIFIATHPLIVGFYKEILIILLIAALIMQHLKIRELQKGLQEKDHSNNLIKPNLEDSNAIETPVSPTPSVEKPIQEKANKKSILIIEDHQDIRLYLTVLFKNDYILHMAENGEEGLKKAQELMPDLIITDIMMPIMDGFECTRLLKENLTTCHIPIIQLTALSNDNDAIKGMELGADDYIIKPFNPEILKTKVKRLIKNRQDLKDFYSQLINPQSEKESNADNRQKIAEELEQKDPFMSKLLGIIEDNISNKEFSVKKLADSMNVSQPTLYRRVKQATDYSIIELIRATRLKKAAKLLKTHAHSISETAELVGYSDIPTFRKHFTEYYGATPSSFAPSHIQAEK